jgi:hypothetical protein
LSEQQKQVLAPLAPEFDSLTEFRREKWLRIARRYPTMKPEEQQRLQTQMRTWAGLTHEQRLIARENYKKISKLPPEKKLAIKQKWEEYQRLPEAEKRKLAESAAKTPPGAPAKKITPTQIAPAPGGAAAPAATPASGATVSPPVTTPAAASPPAPGAAPAPSATAPPPK